MSQQQKSDKTRFQKTQSLVLNSQHMQIFNGLDSSFHQLIELNNMSKQASQQVLKKVSQTIVRVHSSLVPKTEKLQIYRDLSRQQHQLLQKVKNDPLIHTIYAGSLAIESCLKEIGKQEVVIMGRLMKAVTVMLTSFKKFQAQIMGDKNSRSEQNTLKLWDSIKLIVNELHKLPTAKLKTTERQKHNELVKSINITDDILNIINKDQNILFSSLVQENNLQKAKITQLEKKLTFLEKQKNQLNKNVESLKLLEQNENKIKNDQTNINYINITSKPITLSSSPQQNAIDNETASESRNTHDSFSLIKQLNQQLSQKNEIIKKMNYEFTLEIEKYDKIFHKLEEENKMLRKYGDIQQMIRLIDNLEYEIGVLKQEKRQYHLKFNHLVSQINSMALINNNDPYDKYDQNKTYEQQLKQKYSTRPRLDTRINPNVQQPWLYETNKRSRCPSVSPTNKQQNLTNRYFSPKFQPTLMSKKNHNNQQQPITQGGPYKNFNFYSKLSSKYKRDSSPTFGSPNVENKQYETLNERVSTRQNYRARQPMISPRYELPSHITTQVHKSRSKQNPMRISQMDKNQFQTNKLKHEMKRSKFLNQDLVYL